MTHFSETFLRANCLISMLLTEKKYQGTLRYLMKKATDLTELFLT